MEFGNLLLRWLHVIAAIAWIGESIYFVMLDNSLHPPRGAESKKRGVFGEMWAVHGGGFYHNQKYLTNPAELPDDLHWSFWKAYTTWLSGFALLCLLYLFSPGLYLIDPAVAALTPTQAVLAALAFPPGAWLIYDLLCRVAGFRDAWLGALVGLLVLGLCFAATHLFAGRAAFLLVGASLGTIMSANVFFVIIPGQKRMVAALSRGATPDPLPGLRGKQRSVHNTYLTLPVVFAMLSIHYGTATVHAQSWLVLALFMLAGAMFRQFFVLWHGGRRAWGLLAAGIAVLLGTFAWLAPSLAPARPAPPSAPDTAAVQRILEKHCTACHSAHPGLVASAPNGVQFDNAAQIERYAPLIHRQVVMLRVMPPGNVTGISELEREEIGRWYQGHAASDP